jgi:hypothetical protein
MGWQLANAAKIHQLELAQLNQMGKLWKDFHQHAMSLRAVQR